MAVQTLNTSIAKKIVVDIFNYDSLPLSAAYKTGEIPIDLTGYAFNFHLYDGDVLKKTYTIAAGELTSTYLDKTSVNVLEMRKMFENLRDIIKLGSQNYRLVQVVTNNESNNYVHIIYQINGRKY